MSDNPAKDIEITPEMIEAGEKAIFASGAWPDLATADWSSDLVDRVYQAMEDARCSKQYQARKRNPAK